MTRKRKAGPGQDPALKSAADMAKAAAKMAQAAAGGEPGEGELEGQLEELSEDAALAQTEFEAAANAVPGSAEALVFRRNRLNQWATLDTISPSQVTTSQFAEMYGGGSYKVLFRGPGSGKKRGLLVFRPGYRMIEVDESIPAKAPPRFRQPAAAAAAPNAPAPGGFDFGAEVMKTQMMLLQTMGAILAKAAAPDPLVAKLLEVQLAKKDRDPIADALRLRELVGGGNGSPLKERLEELELIQSLAGGSGGGGEGGSSPAGYLQLAEKGIELISGLMARSDPPAALPAPAASSSSSSGPEAPAPSSPPAPAAPGQPVAIDPLVQQVTRFIPTLIAKAEQDRDPDLWARNTVEEVPAGFHRRLLAFARQEGLLEQLGGQFPAVRTHAEWFGEYLERLVEALEFELEGKEAPAANGQTDG